MRNCAPALPHPFPSQQRNACGDLMETGNLPQQRPNGDLGFCLWLSRVREKPLPDVSMSKEDSYMEALNKIFVHSTMPMMCRASTESVTRTRKVFC